MKQKQNEVNHLLLLSSKENSLETVCHKTNKKTVEDDNVEKSYRLHLSGFRESVSALDIESRLSSFGSVSKTIVPESMTECPRGFAFCSLKTTPRRLRQCFGLFNGSLWRGGKLRIVEATVVLTKKTIKNSILPNKQNATTIINQLNPSSSPVAAAVAASSFSLLTNDNRIQKPQQQQQQQKINGIKIHSKMIVSQDKFIKMNQQQQSQSKTKGFISSSSCNTKLMSNNSSREIINFLPNSSVMYMNRINVRGFWKQRTFRIIRNASCSKDIGIPISDDTLGVRSMWKRSRYGRAVRVMRRLPVPAPLGGGYRTVDPAMFKENIERLYLNPRPTSINSLTWTFENSDSLISTFRNIRNQFNDNNKRNFNENSNKSYSFNKNINQNKQQEYINSSYGSLNYNQEKNKDYDCDDQDDFWDSKERYNDNNNEIKSSHLNSELLNKRFNSKNDLSSSSSDDDKSITTEDNPLDLFGSENCDEKTLQKSFDPKKQFDGNDGSELLRLQQKTKGDTRFKFGEEFGTVIKKLNVNETAVEDEDLKERNLSMKLLNNMFGDSNITNKKQLLEKQTEETSKLTGIEFFDPTKEDLKVKLPQNLTKKKDINVKQPIIIIPQRKHEVKGDMATIFPKGGPTIESKEFSLFGPPTELQPFSLQLNKIILQNNNKKDYTENKNNKNNGLLNELNNGKRLVSTRFFIDNETLAAKSNSTKTIECKFKSELSNDGIKDWNNFRKLVVHEAKKRHKNALHHEKNKKKKKF